jgi:hypothetical protein
MAYDIVEFISKNSGNFHHLQFSKHVTSLPVPPAAMSPRCNHIHPTHIANSVGGRAVGGKKAFKLVDMVKRYYWIN